MIGNYEIYNKVMNINSLSNEEIDNLLVEFDLGMPEYWVVIVNPRGEQFLVLKENLVGNETILRQPDKKEMIRNLI